MGPCLGPSESWGRGGGGEGLQGEEEVGGRDYRGEEDMGGV